MSKSWQTSAGGLLGGLALIAGQLSNLFDADTATVCDWNIVASAVGIVWVGLAARDNKVSSEEVGAVK